MSEGARHHGTLDSLFLRLSDKRRPTVPFAAGPERADEGGGPEVGAAKKTRVSSRYALTPALSRRERDGVRGTRVAYRLKIAPEPSSFPCVGTGRPAAERENRPPLRVPRRNSEALEPSLHARHPSPPPGNAAVSGAHSETSVRV